MSLSSERQRLVPAFYFFLSWYSQYITQAWGHVEAGVKKVVELLIKHNIMPVDQDDITETSSSEAVLVELRNKQVAIILFALYYRPLNRQYEWEEQIWRETAASCKTHWVILENFSFSNTLTGTAIVPMVWMGWNLSSVFRKVPQAKLDLLLRNWLGQVTKVSVALWDQQPQIAFKIFMDIDRAGSQVKVLNYRKANFNGNRQELVKV